MKKVFSFLLALTLLLGSGLFAGVPARAEWTPRDLSGWTDVVQLAVGKDCVLGVRKDGMVLRLGGERSGLQQVDRWKDIRQILITEPATGDIADVAVFGLRKDGTVISSSQADLSGWRNIRQIVSCKGIWVAGLAEDGTVRVTGKGELCADMLKGGGYDASSWDGKWLEVSDWKNVVELVPLSGWTMQNGLAGICADGRVRVSFGGEGREYAENWTDIVGLCGVLDGVIGLKKDGTLALPPYELFEGDGIKSTSPPDQWRNVVKLKGGFQDDLFAITKDGRVEACYSEMAYPFAQTLKTWAPVQDMLCTWEYAIGITRDGRIVWAGEAPYDFSALSGWKNVKEILSAGDADSQWILGLQTDGRVCAAEIYGSGANNTGGAAPAPAASTPLTASVSVDQPRDGRVYFSSASATSELREEDVVYTASNVIKEKSAYPWSEGVRGWGEGETLSLYFDGTKSISALSVRLGFAQTDELFTKNNRPSRLRFSFSDGSSVECDFRDMNQELYVHLSQTVETWYVEVTILSVYSGTDPYTDDTCIATVRAYGY